jgi:hypothetical protein
LQEDLRGPAGLEVLGDELQAGQPLQGSRMGFKKIRALKGVMVRHGRHSLPDGQPPVEIISRLVGIPGPINVGFPFIIPGKNAHHRISGYPAHVRRHHDMPPVQEAVEG